MPDVSAAEDDFSLRQRTFTDLYCAHHAWLHGWLRKKLGCSQRAADLAHEAFIRVLSLADPHSIKEPRAFLATTAGRLLIDGARRRRIEQAYLEALAIQAHDASMPDPEAVHVALEALEKIAVMLAGLPAKPREAFLLSRLDGLTYSEIALQLNVSASTVKNYVASALVHCYTTLYGAPSE
ncbi:sigma-70 family RNA polymerase sigma factor [Pseudomonas sp. MYb118]|uniref:sigma-70 family RNA polymerase sigma factor n=1 Tax=Pseudomonas sp. MYb118 TaxID=1848720 RepID=UPI0034CE6CDA